MEPVLYEHKVQYYETDKMDCVHHSNYIRWFEEARTYLMDQGGVYLLQRLLCYPQMCVRKRFQYLWRL